MSAELKTWVGSIGAAGIICLTILGFILQIRLRRRLRALRKSEHRSFFSPLRLIDPFKAAEFYLLLLTILIGIVIARGVLQWAM
jgi:hypothetical protein